MPPIKPIPYVNGFHRLEYEDGDAIDTAMFVYDEPEEGSEPGEDDED